MRYTESTRHNRTILSKFQYSGTPGGYKATYIKRCGY